jgi:hypothetical protein
MARIEWVKQRLENWALWKARDGAGGLGFSATTSFLHEVDTSRYRESRIPVDEVDASVTEEAIEALKFERSHIYHTLHFIYLHGLGIKETARQMQRAESTIKAQLDQADTILSVWFADRKRRGEEARAALQAAIASRR